MRIHVRVKGAEDLDRALAKMSTEDAKKIKREVYASGLDVQRKAKENLKDLKAWDTGNAANMILADRSIDGMTCKIEATAPYSIYVEEGTRPHFPPLDALEGWAKRHGFDSAWPICKVISERGLPARPFLFPAWVDLKDVFFKKVRGILAR